MHRRKHVGSLRESDNGSIARADCDLSLMPVLLDGQNYLGFELVAQKPADFVESRFDFFADDGE
jgi:hypothetical protein